jgi:hypothetical protein
MPFLSEPLFCPGLIPYPPAALSEMAIWLRGRGAAPRCYTLSGWPDLHGGVSPRLQTGYVAPSSLMV